MRGRRSTAGGPFSTRRMSAAGGTGGDSLDSTVEDAQLGFAAEAPGQCDSGTPFCNYVRRHEFSTAFEISSAWYALALAIQRDHVQVCAVGVFCSHCLALELLSRMALLIRFACFFFCCPMHHGDASRWIAHMPCKTPLTRIISFRGA